MQIAALTPSELAAVRQAEDALKREPQLQIDIKETLHEGVYTRTAFVPENVVLSGALMKVPTTLLVIGRCVLTLSKGTAAVDGFASFTSPAGRKTLFRTLSATKLVMVFATKAQSLEEARKEFTDDVLQGEEPCQE